MEITRNTRYFQMDRNRCYGQSTILLIIGRTLSFQPRKNVFLRVRFEGTEDDTGYQWFAQWLGGN